MTIADTRRLAKYYGNLYRITQDLKDREILSYLRGILFNHNIKTKNHSKMKTTILALIFVALMSSCAGNFHLHNSVIEQTDCYNSSKDTSYYASVPYINHNYVYKVNVKYDTVTYEEIEKKKMWTNWKGPLGITLHAAAWIALIALF